MIEKVIAFIVLHYNCFEETDNCITSILNMNNQQAVRIVVIDNASKNDSYSRLKEKYDLSENIVFERNESNVGYSIANNIGLEVAMQHWTIDFAVFTNNDILFTDKDFIEKVNSEYEKSEFDILSPDIYNPHAKVHQSPISLKMARSIEEVNRSIVLNRIALLFYPLYFKLFVQNKEELLPGVNPEKLVYCKNVVPCGACLVVSEKLIRDKKKVFSPVTKFYYEEYILSYWCWRNKRLVVFDPNIRVIHNHGQSTKSIGNKKEVTRFKMENMLDSLYVYKELITKD